jgi:hypothetical protein
MVSGLLLVMGFEFYVAEVFTLSVEEGGTVLVWFNGLLNNS